MLREDCRFGDIVEFGRENGAVTKAKIIKLNDKKAKVQTIEQRNSHPAGTVWSVPYNMLQPTVIVKLTAHELAVRKGTVRLAIKRALDVFEVDNYHQAVNDLKEATTLMMGLDSIQS